MKPELEESKERMGELIAIQTREALNNANLPAMVLSPKEIMDVTNECLIQRGLEATRMLMPV